MSELEADPLAPLRATFAGVVANLTNPKLDAKGAHGAKYTSLGELTNHLRPLLADARISVMHELGGDSTTIEVVLVVLDIDTGDRMVVGRAAMPFRDAQQLGGIVTYLRRYLLTAAFGIVGDHDDDGKAASAPARRPGKPSNDQPSTVRPVDTISPAQLKALQTRYSVLERPERLALWAGKIGRPVESANELTKAEAITLLTEDDER